MSTYYFQPPESICVGCGDYSVHNCYVCIDCCICDTCMYESGRLDFGEEE